MALFIRCDATPIYNVCVRPIGFFGSAHSASTKRPVCIQLKSRDGSKIDYLLQRRDMQMLAAELISDPSSAAQLLAVYLAIDRGVEAPLGQIPARLLPDHLVAAGKPISLEAMPIAMDIASGMTASIQDAIDRFMEGDSGLAGSIEVDLPEMAPGPREDQSLILRGCGNSRASC